MATETPKNDYVIYGRPLKAEVKDDGKTNIKGKLLEAIWSNPSQTSKYRDGLPQGANPTVPINLCTQESRH